ncbi:MAG: 2-oxoisovalerate dehydrogenase [Gammaproteobacteria bacterium]|nr:2-oxoisovalerate dehydrogenase [Gammaproteobacteria bacterium]
MVVSCNIVEQRTCRSGIIFEITEDEIDGGYSASALGYGIHAEGETLEEIHRKVREAFDCYFDETMERPSVIRLSCR